MTDTTNTTSAAPATEPTATTQPAATQTDTKSSVLAPPKEAPEVKYDLKAPEGVKVDPKDLEGIAAFAKEHKISPEAAQKILERDLAQRQSFGKQLQESQSKQIDQWIGALESDKEFGGAKYDENIAVAAKGLNSLVEKNVVPAEFKKMLEQTGLYAEPNLVKIFHYLGKMASESSTFAKGSSAPQSTQPTLRDLFK